MKDIVIYVRLEHYLREWLVHSMGQPCPFPPRSYEQCLLRRYLRKPPAGYVPRRPGPEDVAIVLPDNALRRPEYYHHLGRDGTRRLCEGLENLFRIDLWQGCSPLLARSGELNKGIDEWCASHGIGLDHREAVRQKFYRMRKAYEADGIFLGKKYRKNCHVTGRNCTSAVNL